MNILLVCAGGLSTSILMKKLQKYSDERGLGDSIKAVGMGSYQEVCKSYDVILLGPQISYREDDVKKATQMPVAPIPPMDYGMGNSENIFRLAEQTYRQTGR